MTDKLADNEKLQKLIDLLSTLHLTPSVKKEIEKKFPDVPFSGLLTLAEHSAILDGQYFMCDLKDMKRIADATDE